MSDRAAHALLTAALDRAGRSLRGLHGLARMLAAAAFALGLVALAAWLARAGVAGPAWVLALWLLVLLALVAGVVLARRAIGRFRPRDLGAVLEATGAWRRGALTTVLDPVVGGTSTALHDAAVVARATEVNERAAEALASVVGQQRTIVRRAAFVALGALILLVAARPSVGRATVLWQPLDAWNALTAPVRLVARQAAVARGQSATLDVTAFGYRTATLYTRAPGEQWHTTEVRLDDAGRAVITTQPLSAELVARVDAGGRRSPEVHVTIQLAAFLGSFTVTAHYPAYLALDDETLPTTGDTLLLPEGTRLVLDGRATVPLAAAHLGGADGVIPLAVAGMAFRGELVPQRSATWQLMVTPVSGVLGGERPSLTVRVIADSAPVVDIPIPGMDTVAGASLNLPLVISARDDHGLTALAIETRRGAAAPARMAVALPPDRGDRALVTLSLDLAALGAKPGDTVHYVAVAQDNAPARHAGRSREYLIRIPTEAEQREARTAETGATGTALDSLRSAAGRVQRSAEDLTRGQARSDPKPGNNATPDGQPKAPPPLDAVRKAQTTADDQQKVLDDAAKLQRQVTDLQNAAQRAGLTDTSLARQLRDIGKLLDQALSPELKARLDSLRDALKNLDADQMNAAMQQLARDESQLKQALDQAQELFKRAALETDLANVAQEARDVAAAQDTALRKLATPDSGRSASAEQALARRADSLAAALDRAAAKVPGDSTRHALSDAATQAHAAAGDMQRAAQAAQQQQTGQAQSAAKAAEDKLGPLGNKISKARQGMQQQMRAEVMRALDRALQETSRLAAEQMGVSDAIDRGAILSDTRAEQGMIEEGAAKVMQQVIAVAATNALISPQAGVSIAAARDAMRSAVTAMSAASPDLHTAGVQAGDAVDALDVAAFALMQSKDKVDGSQSATGMQEALSEMQQMAGKQGQLAQQASGMMQQGQMGMQQMLQLAAQQRAIAQQMARLR
ncbi:MAG TPA: hypothetical protein VHW65_11450, partial [Gemmatimonadales bacterium]|nr:hypothetical protein [Gemmatimonadales bacterium]